MRLLQFLAVLLFIGFTGTSQAQPLSWVWSESIGGAGSSDGNMDMTRDATGNTYLTGNFTGTQVFGSISLTATGFNEIFVVKMGPTGNVIWAIKGGANFAVANATGIVMTNNRLYVAGTFGNVFTCGGVSVNSAGQNDIFMMELDPANGALVWLNRAGGANDDKVHDMDAVANGGFLIAGTFTTSADFGSINLSNGTVGNIDLYMAKYDGSGNCSWAVKAGGPNTDEAYGIVQNSIGTIYLTGYFQETAFFDATTSVTSVGFYDFFLAKYTSLGGFVYVVRAGGLANDFGSALGIDNQGDIYVTGFISDTAYFGNYTIIDNYAGNIFMAKYNPAGFCLWAIDEGGFAFDIPGAMSTDPLGGSYVTGFLTATANLSGTILNATNDPYIAKYDKDGNMRWATMLPSTGNAAGKAILADVAGFCNLAGYYFGTINIGTSTFNAPPNQFGSYVARLGGGTLSLSETLQTSFSLYPNPASDYLHIDISDVHDEIFTVELISVDGKVVRSERGEYGKMFLKYRVDISDLPAGTYFAKVSSSNGDATSKSFVIN